MYLALKVAYNAKVVPNIRLAFELRKKYQVVAMVGDGINDIKT